jgi:hypothetical protein
VITRSDDLLYPIRESRPLPARSPRKNGIFDLDFFEIGPKGGLFALAHRPDTLVASANAYLGALNKLMIKRQRGKPEAMVAQRLNPTPVDNHAPSHTICGADLSI